MRSSNETITFPIVSTYEVIPSFYANSLPVTAALLS